MQTIFPFLNSFNESFTHKDKYEKLGWQKLGKDFYLKPIKAFKSHLNYNYGYLCKGDTQLSDDIYRKGGLGCGKFEYGYCSLLWYGKTIKPDLGLGYSVIVDETGSILVKGKSIIEQIYLLKGCIYTHNQEYYSLRTGELLAIGYSSSLKSTDYIFVESFKNDKLGLVKGVYQIEFLTGNITIWR